MHFCEKCDNMYYIRLSGENANELLYYCRKCGHEESGISVDNLCVSKTQFKRSEGQFSNFVNKYTKMDPTLPRVKNIPCPNKSCPSNTGSGENREVIAIRYDETNIKYIYMCGVCDKVWKLDENN